MENKYEPGKFSNDFYDPIDWFEVGCGIKEKDLPHLYEQDPLGYLHVSLNSQFDPIELGRHVKTGVPFHASIEQFLKHIHFVAPTEKGKSTTLIGLIEAFANAGFGTCTIDSSNGGDTVKKLLGHFQRTKQKYLYIDLNLSFNPVLNPFGDNKYKSIVHLKDVFKVTFGGKDSAATANISKYLPAIMHLLWNAEMSLVEAKYFTTKFYKHQQNYIFEKSREAELKKHFDPHHRKLVLEALIDYRIRERFISTTSRLEALNHPAIHALFGHTSTINLGEFMASNGHILLNADLPELDEIGKRFVCTMLINLVLYHHRAGHHYFLFVDEAQDYATPKLGELLDKQAKSGLHIGLLNHHLDQFEDRKLRTSVKLNTPIKFEFIKKREAWVTLNEMSPVYLRMPEVYTNYGTPKPSEFTRDRKIILHKISQRIPDFRKNSASSLVGTAPDGKTNRPDNSKARGRELWNDLQPRDEVSGTAGRKKAGKKTSQRHG